MPDLSYAKARYFINRLGLNPQAQVLDFGCAKGFVVRALREYGMQAYGYDISRYAVENADPTVACFVGDTLPVLRATYDWVLAEKVLEHIPKKDVVRTLLVLHEISKHGVLAVIPLADRAGFIIPKERLDKTHVTLESPRWWVDRFRDAGFEWVEYKLMTGREHDQWDAFPDGVVEIVAR
jgi:SAM-dependent methyltransferase